MLLLTFCKSEGKDAELDISGLCEFFGTGNDCRSCCHYIIDDEQVLAADGGAVGQLKHFLNILIPLPTVLGRLTTFKLVPSYYLVIYWQPGYLIHTSRNLHTLVVASLPFSFSGEWNGYYPVDSFEEVASLQFPGQHPSHGLSYLGMVLVLQFVDDIGSLGMSLIVEEGGGAFDGYLPPEHLGHDILFGIALKTGSGQVKVALAADDFFCDRKSLATDGT